MKGIKAITRVAGLFVVLSFNFVFTAIAAPEFSKDIQSIKIKIAFGLTAPARRARTVQLINTSPGLTIVTIAGNSVESNDRIGKTSLLYCGAGDVDELIAEINFPQPTATPLQIAQHDDNYSINGDGIWGYLLENGSPGQIKRLKQDKWNQPDEPILTVALNKEKTEGFSVALEQLLTHKAMWLPEHDIFITLADNPVDFKKHLSSLKGERVLHFVKKEPDASREQFNTIWADIGNPLTWNVPWETRYMGTKGHLIVTAAAHGSIYKFAVDRWGKVRPDFASPYKFKLDLLGQDNQWKGQKIVNGLPIIVTHLEKNGQQYEMEQFASAVSEIKREEPGDIPSVLFTKIRISGKNGPVNFNVSFNNELKNHELQVEKLDKQLIVTDKQTGGIVLTIKAGESLKAEAGEIQLQDEGQQVVINITGQLADGKTEEVLVKLPSPSVSPSAAIAFNNLDVGQAKEKTVRYWEQWLSEGAYFNVPEEKVNQLFRANLWHALILPRHTLDSNGHLHMDLPYANTAYGQKDADWPINQAVYVDYMIYGLRGYDKVATDEYAAMFQSQQKADGRIGGFANWGVYSPGQLYAIAQNYLLSHNKQQFDRLLHQSLKTLDWCLAQIDKANHGSGSSGLIVGPLNDLTHAEREWAFTQAYYVAGLELFGKALSVYGHPRANEVSAAAAKMKEAVIQEFARSSVKSPVVQLADGTWSNYVPTDAMTPRRMLDQWYPTDVDCGPLHLSRLNVLSPYSWLTTAMLNDHEDNLFLKNRGAANEPVYVQQGNTYLLRDEPKSVIRAFYSLMACGFSHEQLTSLEHRWAWGQYYGPPSTDGAWFELYRKMLINEIGMDTLMIGQAIPRAWLQKEKEIEVRNAPTYFGPVSFTMKGQNSKEIKAVVEISDRHFPKQLLIRFRHPEERPIRSVIVNGKNWEDFDVQKEYVRIPNPKEKKYLISVNY